MTKLSEKIEVDGNKLYHARTFDPTTALTAAKMGREGINSSFGEMQRIGTIPGWLVSQWCNEAGIKHSDNEARMSLIKRKLQSGEYNAFLATEKKF